MAFYVKVIPPSWRARIHAGDCEHCRDGQGQKNQDKGTGPTRWEPEYPAQGMSLREAEAYMAKLGYRDTDRCYYCKQRGAFDA